MVGVGCINRCCSVEPSQKAEYRGVNNKLKDVGQMSGALDSIKNKKFPTSFNMLSSLGSLCIFAIKIYFTLHLLFVTQPWSFLRSCSQSLVSILNRWKATAS